MLDIHSPESAFNAVQMLIQQYASGIMMTHEFLEAVAKIRILARVGDIDPATGLRYEQDYRSHGGE